MLCPCNLRGTGEQFSVRVLIICTLHKIIVREVSKGGWGGQGMPLGSERWEAYRPLLIKPTWMIPLGIPSCRRKIFIRFDRKAIWVCYFVCRIVLAQVKVRGHARLKTAMSFWFYKGEGFLYHLIDCHRSECILLCVIEKPLARIEGKCLCEKG